MSGLILLLAVFVLVVLEKYWPSLVLKNLRFRGSADRITAEPGQLITWSATVENRSRLPVPFVRLRQGFPKEASVHADERWVRSHCSDGIRKWNVEEKMALAPRQSRTRSLRFSISKRGSYQIGGYRLSAGDLLGLREEAKLGEDQSVVIIPERAKNGTALQALGGFLGDISVRRFILEDPILTVGFRDYTGREPLKAVSWTRTAITGSMQVKQYDHTAEQNVVILLNVEGGTPEQLEGCFRLMRSACEALEWKKIPFGLRTNGHLSGPVGNIFHMSDGLGSRHVDTILYALGRADYTCYHSFRYLCGQTLKYRKNNESYIVITPFSSDEVSQLAGMLGNAVGSSVCVLTGEAEVTQP